MKKGLLIVALTVFLGAVIASVPSAKAPAGVSLKFRYPEGYDYYPSEARDLWVIADIEAPEALDNTKNGIIAWTFDVSVDPTVLEPVGAYASYFGYYLYDFCDYYGYTENYPSILVGSIDKTTGDMIDICETIMGWETLGVGAGGNSGPDGWYGRDNGLVKLRYKPLQPGVPNEYSKIEITDAWYYTADGGKHPFDYVEFPGHYCAPLVPEFPLGAAVEVGLIAAVAYIWWTRRRKPKEVP